MTIDIETITDRTTYITWRTDWRLRYAKASEDVRIVKRELVRALADLRTNAPRIEGRTHEYRIDACRFRLPGLRSTAHAIMCERALGTDRRDQLLGSGAQDEAMAA